MIEMLLFARHIVAAFRVVSSSFLMYTEYVMAIPIPAEQDQADCDSPFIQVSGSRRYSGCMLNMYTNPSSVPSLRSMTKARNNAENRRMNKETIRITLTFSMAFAPFHIAAIVISTARVWNKITWDGSCRKVFQTSVVSTSDPSPPRTAVWK